MRSVPFVSTPGVGTLSRRGARCSARAAGATPSFSGVKPARSDTPRLEQRAQLAPQGSLPVQHGGQLIELGAQDGCLEFGHAAAFAQHQLAQLRARRATQRRAAREHAARPVLVLPEGAEQAAVHGDMHAVRAECCRGCVGVPERLLDGVGHLVRSGPPLAYRLR